MADKKISELTELNSASATDIIPIVNSGETKFIEVQNLVPDNIVQTITNGDTTHTPSSDAVFDALALKQATITLTTTGTSGASTLIANTLNIPQYSGATDLTYTASPTNGIVVSSTGTDATIPLADGTNAGLITPAEKTKLANTSGTNTGDQTITLTSDVTGSGTGSFATTIVTNVVSNTKLAQMGANTVKVNNTNATANATDLTLTTNTVLGRESGNISALPIQDVISSTAQLVAGTITVVDGRITVNSFVSGLAISSTGTSTSEIKWTASAGVMTFTSVVGTDTALFGYTIVIV